MLNIMDYGAAADGVAVNTKAIQRAIDLCGRGDTVYVPKGKFITGALYLKSNMTLFIEEGARLMGSGSIEDFPVMGYPFEGLDQLCYASLINTDGALYLDGFYGDAEFDADTPEEINDGTPEVDGIYFKNIDIKTVGGNAVYLCGLPERHFKNVFLENVKAHGRYGIKHKNIDNLKLINVDITSDEE